MMYRVTNSAENLDLPGRNKHGLAKLELDSPGLSPVSLLRTMRVFALHDRPGQQVGEQCPNLNLRSWSQFASRVRSHRGSPLIIWICEISEKLDSKIGALGRDSEEGTR